MFFDTHEPKRTRPMKRRLMIVLLKAGEQELHKTAHRKQISTSCFDSEGFLKASRDWGFNAHRRETSTWAA
jgi:hypothetical protein